METKKVPVVVCMIVKNEEALLARCLDTVKEADAIYIADTGSTDKTVEIAKRYTQNVFTDYKWEGHFANARNHVLSKVKEEGAWVLSIDADEFLQTPFSDARTSAEEADARGEIILDTFLVNEGDAQKHSFPRLFKKCPEVFWSGAAHNHLSVLPKTVAKVSIVYGYSPAHLLDKDRTLNILTNEVEIKKTGGPRERYYLAREYWYRNNYVKALEHLKIYVTESKFMAEKADAYLTMARCYWFMGMGEEARQACLQALLCNAHFKEAAYFMATVVGKGSANPLWEKNAQQWEKLGEHADNSGVLFIRKV